MTQIWNNYRDTVFENIDSLDEDSLDILELFAQSEYLTITQITNTIKSTKLHRNYKNTYYFVRKLESLNLIEQIVDDYDNTRRRHNKKCFKLTNRGIYQLFHKMRYHGIITDQLSVKKGRMPFSNVDVFMKHYSNNTLFNLFLYPYFEKQTVFEASPILLVRLFQYLHNCCEQIDATMKITYMIPQFSWNKVPGENDNELLTSLKEVFGINNLSNAIISKSPDGNAIKITASKLSIVIQLETSKGKAIATIESNTEPKGYEYKILNYFSEPTTFRPKASINEPDSKRLVERPICDLVSDIVSASTQQEESVIRLLAKDTRFMKVVDEIYTKFTGGYNALMAIRKSL